LLEVDSHPTPADIILVIEVADSSIRFDRETKAPLYAAAGIGEYWIVNLIDNRLEIYRQPEGSIYTSIEIITPPRSIALPQFSDIVVQTSDFFPPRKLKTSWKNRLRIISINCHQLRPATVRLVRYPMRQYTLQ
jgi:Uma2 family endonuclease